MTRNYLWFHSDTARARPSLETSQFLPFQVATIKKRSFANNLASSSRVFLKNRVSHVAKPLKRLNRRSLRTRITVVLSAHIKSSRSCLLNPVVMEKRKWSNKTTLMTMIYYYRKAVIKSRTKSVVIIIRS